MTANKPGDPLTLNRLYGRSSGHKLRKGQKELVEKLLPQIEVPADGEVTAAACSARFARCISRSVLVRASIWSTAPTCSPITASSARSRSSTESPPRSATSATGILTNVRLWRGDALEVLQRVPDGALSFLYLLHPDPWPKARHAKRRMVNDRPVDLFAAKLRPNGEFRLATDDPTYLNWSLMVMQRHQHQFDWLAERPKDFLEPSGGWIETRYGAKSRREGRRPYYLRYRRL